MNLPEQISKKIMPEPNSGCWFWLASTRGKGYGQIRWRGKMQYAHRVVFEILNGRTPAGLIACHKCDIPFCVNPDHIFLGTPADNRTDCIAKGRYRTARGEDVNTSKLNEDQVLAIRRDKRKQVDIAADYRISQRAVSLIKRRETWRHLP